MNDVRQAQPPQFVDPAHQAQFEATGYVTAAVFSPKLLDRLRRAYEETARAATGFHATMYRESATERRAVYELLKPALAERLPAILTGYVVRVANWVVKEGGSEDSRLPFHQDWSFVDETTSRSLNVWCPLVDADESNGCLIVVGGSHRVSTDHRSHQAGHCRFQDLLPTLMRSRYARPIPMKAGQGIFYDGALLHASGQNRSGRRRVAAACVLVPESATMIHCYRVSEREVEVYEVDDALFWSHVPGERPRGAKLLGLAESLLTQHGEEALRLLKRRAE
jgi:hypothetical protein